MGNAAGVPRDFEALEKRRFQAIQMLERGLSQAEIARQFRVVRQTVARWVHDYRTEGKSALRKAGRAGRMPRLNEKQRQQLEKYLVAGPERLGYETPDALWLFVQRPVRTAFDLWIHSVLFGPEEHNYHRPIYRSGCLLLDRIPLWIRHTARETHHSARNDSDVRQAAVWIVSVESVG
jgi:transposase-like protein